MTNPTDTDTAHSMTLSVASRAGAAFLLQLATLVAADLLYLRVGSDVSTLLLSLLLLGLGGVIGVIGSYWALRPYFENRHLSVWERLTVTAAAFIGAQVAALFLLWHVHTALGGQL